MCHKMLIWTRPIAVWWDTIADGVLHVWRSWVILVVLRRDVMGKRIWVRISIDILILGGWSM